MTVPPLPMAVQAVVLVQAMASRFAVVPEVRLAHVGPELRERSTPKVPPMSHTVMLAQATALRSALGAGLEGQVTTDHVLLLS